MIDELDLALVDALRVDPRAPWSRLAAPLGVDPATFSRRWARLTAVGDAWVTCYPSTDRLGYGLTALVEVECAADRVAAVAARLARDPQTASIELVTGSADLLLTVGATEPALLTRYVLDRVGAVPGVLRTRTALVERTVREGSRWHDGALDPEQREAIAAVPAAGGPAGGIGPAGAGARAARVGRAGVEGPAGAGAQVGAARGPGRQIIEDRSLLLALGEDGRMPYAELAQRTGLPATTVRRRLAELRDSGRLVLRCDASPRLTGHPVGLFLWLDLPADRLESAAAWFATLPQARMCAVTVGPANLVTYLMARQLSELRRLEEELARRFPGAGVRDRQLTLRAVKLVGRLLDDEGRATGYVPIDPWSPWPE
ncbi:Lrp/AsnC family transcriptional regulator [Streptacidiphilus cavernicola]|uniref:Lrp/AsnC family transcriptional regulator n=1 Tax=Streptacidiphilus cavernicola TaxID=3342716 RepID=A0ABV6VRU0_9ACTN